MVDVRAAVLRPPDCTTPAAVKCNENIHKNEDRSYYVDSANKSSSVTL